MGTSTNARPTINPSIQFEEISELDLLSGINSIDYFKKNIISSQSKTYLNAPGEGVDILLEWSLTDIYEAIEKSENGGDNKRNTTNAVLNARRALSCLVDWYMKRDGFYYCKDFRNNSQDKSEILLRLNIIDKLTSKVLQRVIDTRNIAEHEYLAVSIEAAEDAVELIRRTRDSLYSFSNPSELSVVYGAFQYSISLSENNYEYGFYGFSNELLIVQTLIEEPWIGIVLPTNSSEATIRRTFIKDMSCETLFQIHKKIKLEISRYNPGYISDFGRRILDPNQFKILLQLAGLV